MVGLLMLILYLFGPAAVVLGVAAIRRSFNRNPVVGVDLAGLLAQARGVNGMIGGLGMPGMALSMGAPLPPGLVGSGPSASIRPGGVTFVDGDNGSTPPPPEAPTAVIPNLLAGMNRDEVGAFIERVRAQRVSAPEDKRANYDAMIEAAEKRLAEISAGNAATMRMVMDAMDMLAKNMPPGDSAAAGLGVRPGTVITDPIAAARIIGSIMKDLI